MYRPAWEAGLLEAERLRALLKTLNMGDVLLHMSVITLALEPPPTRIHIRSILWRM